MSHYCRTSVGWGDSALRSVTSTQGNPKVRGLPLHKKLVSYREIPVRSQFCNLGCPSHTLKNKSTSSLCVLKLELNYWLKSWIIHQCPQMPEIGVFLKCFISPLWVPREALWTFPIFFNEIRLIKTLQPADSLTWLNFGFVIALGQRLEL